MADSITPDLSRPRITTVSSALSDLQLNSSLSSSAGPYTPADDDSYHVFTEEDDNILKSSLDARWQEAIEIVSSNLRPTELRKIASSFKTWQQLYNHLREKEKEYTSDPRFRLIQQLYPCLVLLKSVSGVLTASMAPLSIQTSIFWGTLYLSLEGAMGSQATLAGTVKFLNEVHEQLRLLWQFFPATGTSISDYRHAIVGMFVALIEFWAEGIIFYRNGPIINLFSEMWPKMNTKFSETQRKLDKAIKTLERIVAFSKGNIDAESRQQDEEYMALVNLHEDSTASFPLYVIDISNNEQFYERSAELQNIQTFLDGAVASQGLHTCVVYGFGGVGKTSLALAYTELAKAQKIYDAIFWIYSETQAELRDSFTEIALRLKLPRASRSADKENNVILVRDWLDTTNKKVLVVYDNVNKMDTLKGYLPSLGPILITSRFMAEALQAPGQQIKRLELGTFSPKAAANVFNNLLLRKKPDAILDNKSTTILLESIDGLALGIEQMVAYIAYHNHTVEEFLIKYQKANMRTGIHKKGAGMGPISRHTLATAWEIHFEYLVRTSETMGHALMGLLSLLSSDKIPLKLFLPGQDIAAASSYLPCCNDESLFEDAVELLMNVALIKRDGPRVSLHRLVQVAFRQSPHGYSENDRQSAFNAITALLNHQFPKKGGAASLFGQWPKCATFEHHVLALASLFKEYRLTKQPLISSPDFDELLKNCAWYQYQIGDFDNSLSLLEIAREACEDKKGKIYAQLCNNTSVIYHERHELPNARKYADICISLRKDLYPPDDVEMGNTYNNQGNLFLSEGKLSEALDFYEKSTEITAKRFEDPLTYLGMCYMAEGRIYYLQRKPSIALANYEKARKIFADEGDAGTWQMANLLMATGNMKYTSSDLEGAFKDFKEALELSAAESSTSSFIGMLHYKMGIVETARKNWDTALGHFEDARVIAGHHDLVGDLARITRGKALLARSRGNSEAAQKLMVEAEIWKLKALERAGIIVIDEQQSEEEVYDMLVCGYMR